ncbi:hypothetical protein PHMEG_0008697 [Phytophthora megakarya]|uniref:Uncharacterized protein n=1 Tax=Phytophthora megakarya TaxID=4795 RepID=A0A225WK31_9STRA|nr:hypothetical protein PHMEG_0008697 [Phytophthora megakarya]
MSSKQQSLSMRGTVVGEDAWRDCDSFDLRVRTWMHSKLRPLSLSRLIAGGTAEFSLRDIVASLQEVWESTFRGEAVVWRVWGNHITRNLDRSIWEALVKQPHQNAVVKSVKLSPLGPICCGLRIRRCMSIYQTWHVLLMWLWTLFVGLWLIISNFDVTRRRMATPGRA